MRLELKLCLSEAAVPAGSTGKEGVQEAISQLDPPAGKVSNEVGTEPAAPENALGVKPAGLPGLAGSGGSSVPGTLQFGHPLRGSREGIRLGLGSLEAVSSL